jgi:signal transduction histidine kinase
MQSLLVRRKRQRSIRVLLAAIFIVPLASLIGLWAFAASVTVSSAIKEHNFKTENTLYGGSAQGLGTQLGQERLIAYEYLSSGRRLPEQELLAQFAKTSATVTQLMNGVRSGPGLMQASAWPALTAWEGMLGTPLNDLRAKIKAGQISPLAAFDGYNKIINAEFGVYTNLIAIDNSTLYREASASIEAGQGLEMAERETTLITGALAAGGQMSRAAKNEFAQAVYLKKQLMADALTKLPPSLGSGYQAILTSAPYHSFQAIENSIINSIGSKKPIPVTPQEFGAASTPLFENYLKAESQDRDALTAEGTSVGNQLLLEVGLAGGVGLLAVVLSVFLMVRFGRRISRELRGLQRAALSLAQERLPDVVQRLSQGEDVEVPAEDAPIIPARILETAKVAEAFASVQRTAVEAAVGQARLRRGVAQVFRNLAWRSQSLLHRQLALLDTMERRQTEPETLDELFQLDHLTTRMRRHAEGLIILSGANPGRGWRDPVPVVDVLRAAIAEVEDYKRVTVVCDSQDAVIGTAVADVIHLMAELIENATTYSPANTEVTVRAERVANGFVAEVEDRGIGISPEDVATYNELLARAPEFDLADSNQLGLFVVARLAAKHHVSVTLRRSPYGGTSAIVLLPNSIVAAADRPASGSFESLRGELQPGGIPALPGPFPGLALVGSERSTTNGTPAIGGPLDGDADPNGAAPYGAVPNGAVPNGAVPNGAVPNGAVPASPAAFGGATNGAADRPGASTNAAGAGAANSGAANSGAANSGAANSGAANSGDYDRIQYNAPAQSPSGGWIGDVVQAEVAARSDDSPLRPTIGGLPPAPSVSGSPPWPPAEPVPDDYGQNQRGASPWFQPRRPGALYDAPPADGPPISGQAITGQPLAGPSRGQPVTGRPVPGPAAGQPPAALPRRRAGTYSQSGQSGSDQGQSGFAPPGPGPRDSVQSGYGQPASGPPWPVPAEPAQTEPGQPESGPRPSVWDRMTPAPTPPAPFARPAPLGSTAPTPFTQSPFAPQAPAPPTPSAPAAPFAPQAQSAPSAQSASGSGAAPLPRRQRQASLAPQLRDSGPTPIEELQDAADGPNPDGTRALVESLQSGFDRARATSPEDEEPWPSGRQPWPSDPWQSTDSWPAGSWPDPPKPDATGPAEDAGG